MEIDKDPQQPADRVEVEASPTTTTERGPSSALHTGIVYFKYLYSLSLLLFSVVIVMAAIFEKQTTATAHMGLHPVAAFLLFWFLINWLATMEGGQGALVGLQMIDASLYSESHPIAFQNTSLVHTGDNMERFIVGRQFLTVIVIFIINMMASAATPDASVFLNLPSALNDMFLGTGGLALILTTVMLGQLTAQVNASNCMLDFLNNYLMLFTEHVSLVIECTGLLHSVYLVQILFSHMSGTPIESNEPPRTTLQAVLFGTRVLISCAVLGFALAVTVTALFAGKTKMWDAVPPVASVVVLLALLAMVGLMEGMQIALFAVVNLPEKELLILTTQQQHPMAHKVCQLTFRGHNLQAFLIGRQICVTLCMFLVARVTTLDYQDGKDGNNLWGVPNAVQAFFNTGLLGALISTLVGSLAWRIVASSFPMEFLSNPLIYVILRLCLVLEASGICSAAWILAVIERKLSMLEPDEKYIGEAQERAAAAAAAAEAARYHEFDQEEEQDEEEEEIDEFGGQPPPMASPAAQRRRADRRRSSNFSSAAMALYLADHKLFADEDEEMIMAESLLGVATTSVQDDSLRRGASTVLHSSHRRRRSVAVGNYFPSHHQDTTAHHHHDHPALQAQRRSSAPSFL